MSVAPLSRPPSTTKYLIPSTQMHPLPLPNTPHPLYHHPSERSPTLAEGAPRRKSTSPSVTLAPIEMHGPHLPPPVNYTKNSNNNNNNNIKSPSTQPQPYNSLPQSHSQRYHYPNESDTMAHVYDQRSNSHQPLPSIIAPYDSNPHPPILTSRQPPYHPYYLSHNHQQRPQYSPPLPHSGTAPGTSPTSTSSRQPPSPQSPDVSIPNTFHPHHSYEGHPGSNKEKHRMTPPVSPTLPLPPVASSSETSGISSSSSISHSFGSSSSAMSTSSTSSRVFGARSGSISLSDRINSLAVVAPSATSVHHPVPIASPNTPTTTPPSPTSSAATLEPLSLHDRRERNKAASAKYRAKKHVQSGEMRHQIQILQDQNSLISRQLEESRAENSSLKTLVEKLKNRIVAQKVLKRLRQVGRDRAPATTTSFVSVTGAASSLVPSGGARKHSRRAKASSSVRAGMAASHVAGILTDESIESVVDDYSHDSEIDELEDTLLAQDDDDDDMDVFGDDDDDDEFNLDSQMSDDSEYDNRAEQMPPMSTKRQRRSSRTSASAAKTSSTAFVAGAPPTPRRSSASSTASTASSASSSNVVHARPPLIVPDIHYE